MADIALRQTDRAQIAVVEAGEEFQWLGAEAVWRVVDPQQLGAVAGKRRHQGITRRIELTHFASDLRAGATCLRLPPQDPAQALEHAKPATDRTAHNRQEQLVDVKLASFEQIAPARMEILGKRVAELRSQIGLHLAANNVMIDGKARRPDRAQHCVAHLGAIVDVLRIGRLE